jgi:hypothetical protein
MWAFSNQMVSVLDMCKSDISLPKRALLDAPKTHPSFIQQKVLEDTMDILEVDLTLGHRINGDDGKVFMAARSVWHNHPMNCSPSLNVLELETSRNKGPRVDGNVGHAIASFSR